MKVKLEGTQGQINTNMTIEWRHGEVFHLFTLIETQREKQRVLEESWT